MAVIQSGSTTDLAFVNSDSEITVSLTKDDLKAGFAKILDSEGNSILTTENNALQVSTDQILMWEQVDGSSLNINLWQTTVSTMAIAQASGFITLNSASSTAANAYAILQSTRYMPLYGPLPLRILFTAKIPMQPQSNLTAEVGIGLVGTNASPTDGAFFRWNSSTQFICIVSNGGSETSSSPITPPTNNVVSLYQIVLVEDLVQFYVNDILVAAVPNPAGIAYPTNNGRLPIFARTYNGASGPSTAPQISIGQVIVSQQAMNQNKAWEDVLASMNRGSYQSPVSSFAQTANAANSSTPSSATLSNTTAGYATLGGKWQFAAVSGAATDYALFAYQVPTGYQLIVKGISISSINTGAIGAITSTILEWGIGVNSSAVSLATIDGAGTWAPRRMMLGLQSFAIAAAIGITATDINKTFNAPMVVDSGRYLHIILQIPVGTATVSQVLRGTVMINGYFE